MIEIRVLRADDKRDTFHSGNVELDRFFKKFAGQNQFRLHIGTTYVATEESKIVGFITVSATSITIRDLPKSSRKRLPKYPLPALRLARLAADQDAQGRGIGRILLKATFGVAHEMADRIGCVAVLVDAKPESVEFYRGYGFEELEILTGELGERPVPQLMVLPIGSIPKPEDV